MKAKFLIFSIILILLIGAILVGLNQKKECKTYQVSECPDRCVVCPPCEVCSSISCQTEEFCTDMGFNRSWYKEIVKTLEIK